MTKSSVALLLVALLGLSVTACGDANKAVGLTSQESSQAQGSDSANATSGSNAARSNLKGDEDDDDESGETSTVPDSDNDFDNDQKDKEQGFYDKDDKRILKYGEAASEADRKGLTAFVRRYFVFAAAEDGTGACSMITATFVQAIPEDYGSGAGPAYLRGKTCPAVMSLLFKHEHKRLTAVYEVTAVRVHGHRAYVVLGSPSEPASYVALEREHGTWKVAGLLGLPLS